VVTDDAAYAAFGRVIASSGSTENEFDWSAEPQLRRDPDTGYTHARRRDYDALITRFLNPDPKAFDSGDPNFYRYAGNNPVTHSDPSGMEQLRFPKSFQESFENDASRKLFQKRLQLTYDSLPTRTIAELQDVILNWSRAQDSVLGRNPSVDRDTEVAYCRQWINRAAALIEEREGDNQNAPQEARERLWKIQYEAMMLQARLRASKRRLAELKDSFLPVPVSAITKLQGEIAILREGLDTRHRIIGTEFRERGEISDWPFSQKFAKAVDYAIKSDKLSLPIKERLVALIEPENLAKLTAFFTTVVAVHALVPEVAGIMDAAFAAFGGAPVLIAAYEIYSAVNNCTDEPDLRSAGDVIAGIMSGALADSVLNLLTWAAGRTAGRHINRKLRERAAAERERSERKASQNEPQFDENTSTEPPSVSEAKPPTALEGDVAANSKFPDAGFSTDVNNGGGITQFNTTFKGVDNSGVLQTTYTKKSRDLYIDVIRSEVQKEGLGEAMLRRTIAEVESKGGPIKTLSGNLEGVNRTEFLKGGLESTPAYKQRQALGFTEVVVSPSKENGYKLVMRKPN